MAITRWLGYLLQQFAVAGAVLCAVLALSEILLPGSVLPYFNLHALIMVVLALCLISPASQLNAYSSAFRLLTALPLAILVLAYTGVTLIGGGLAANAVMLALAGMIVVVMIALVVPSVNVSLRGVDDVSLRGVDDVSLRGASDEAILPDEEREEVIEIIEIEDETSVFMR